MNIAVPKEIVEGERRVALVPETAKRLIGEGHTVRVEHDAGRAAGYPDDAYTVVGVEIAPEAVSLWGAADVILKIHMPAPLVSGGHEADLTRPEAPVIGLLQPLSNLAGVRALAKAKATSFSLDALPRITRAQSMDVLSSMSTVAGYKAVVLAAATLGKFFPMLVTAAGTIAPARVLILGAGVAGLQAIATARRLGAVVEAFDVRAAVKEQVESLGAKFIEDESTATADAEGAGGYAKELSEDQHQRELALIHKHIVDADVVVTTALIPGRPAPELITDAMVSAMRPGSVIVDLAAEAGGNCVHTRAGEDVMHGHVLILGPRNLPSTMPTHASQMFSKNMATFVRHIVSDGVLKLDMEDEITGATCITRNGEIAHEATRKALAGGGS